MERNSQLQDLTRRAKELSYEERRAIITGIPETNLHKELQALFRRMLPQATVEVTHGPQEAGADLLILDPKPFGDTVYACIVHRGDVSGKSAGVIDKLKSQLDQCFSSPKLIPSLGNRYNVNEVWIVITGEFSQRGASRLRTELAKTKPRLFGIRESVDYFTDHYPEIYFDSMALTSIQDQLQHVLKLQEEITESTRDLAESFVNPRFSDIEWNYRVEDSFEVTRTSRNLSLSQLTSSIGHSSRIVIAGDPGAGKTTAILKTTIDQLHDAFAQALRSQEKHLLRVPVFARSIDVLYWENPEQTFTDYLGAKDLLHRFAPSVLLVDGLDELPSELRREALDKAQQFVEYYNAGLVVTMRKIDLFAQPIPGYRRYEILPFEMSQAIRLIEQTVQDQHLAIALKDGLAKFRAQLTLTPLALLMLINLAAQQHEVPATIGELYRRYTDWALGRYNYSQGLAVVFDPAVKVKLLEDLAHRFYTTGSELSMPRDIFDSFVLEFMHSQSVELTEIGRLIDEINRAGLLSINDETVAFRHRSFLEFFLGSVFYREAGQMADVDKTMAELYYDDIWGEAVFYYVAIKKSVDPKLISYIFEQPVTDLKDDVRRLFIGRLLQAGFLTVQQDKARSTKLALENLDSFASTFEAKLQSISLELPKLVREALLLSIVDSAFSSRTLVASSRTVIDDLAANTGIEGVRARVALLAATRPYLEDDFVREAIDQILGVLSKVDPELAAAELIILTEIEDSKSTIRQALTKRLRRLATRQPEIFRRMLPAPRRGFRRRSRNSGT